MRRVLGWILLAVLCSVVAFAQMAQTPNLGLNLPPQGYPNWNTIVNQNFLTLDSAVGGLQHQYQGAWSAAVTYQASQIVAWQNSSWIAIVGANTNNQPDLSPGYWSKLSQGATGNAFELQMNQAGLFGPTTGMTYNTTTTTLSPPNVAAGNLMPTQVNNNVFPTVPRQDAGVMLALSAADGLKTAMQVNAYGSFPALRLRRSNGTLAAPISVNSGDSLGSVNFGGYDGAQWSATQTSVETQAFNAWTATDHSAYMRFLVTPSGSLTVAEAMRIDNNGRLGIGTTTPAAPLDVNGTAQAINLKATSMTPGAAPVCTATDGTLSNAGCVVPPASVQWPPSCTSGVWSPSASGCVPTGSAGNPAGTSGQSQMNAGGVFAAVPGSVSDVNYGWKTQGGINYAKGYQTGAGNNGIVAAAAPGITVVADPSYGLTEQPYSMQSHNFPPGQSPFNDQRLGTNTWMIRDPPSTTVYGGTGATRSSFLTLGCGSTNQQGLLYGTNQQIGGSTECLDLNVWIAGPGANYGAGAIGPRLWTTATGASVQMTVNTRGIQNGLVVNNTKAALGDTANYFYQTSYGGAVVGADEGSGALYLSEAESANTYVGTVEASGGGAGATTITIHCTADCAMAGQGRYLLDLSQGVAANVTAFTNPAGSTPGTLTTDTAFTPSTFFGTLVSLVNVPAAAPIGQATTQVTFSVASGPGNTGAPLAGDLMCFATVEPVHGFHEQARIDSVTGSGPWSVTAHLRMSHPANAWVMDGGTCGSFVDFTANDVAIGFNSGPNQLLRYPIDVLGAKDAHTLVYYYFNFQGNSATAVYGYAQPPVSSGVVTISNAGGLVNIGVNPTGVLSVVNQAVITISGATLDTAYNGTCTNSFISPDNHLSCYQSSSIGHAPISQSVQLSIGSTGFGTMGVMVYPGAEVLSVLDSNAARCVTRNGTGATAPCMDGVLTVEPNNAAWGDSQNVEQPHHYSALFRGFKDNVVVYNPNNVSSPGIYVGLAGSGAGTGGTISNPSGDSAGILVNNTLPLAGTILGRGGVETPAGGLALDGVFNFGLYMQDAPEPIGSAVVAVGCPSGGCSALGKAFYYYPLDLAGGTGTYGTQMRFNPANKSLYIGNNVDSVGWLSQMNNLTMVDTLKFSTIATPVLSTPTVLTTGGSLAQNTTYYYWIVATATSGAATVSAEKLCVVGATGTNTNVCNLDWTKIYSASRYQVCGRTSSGGEKLLATLNSGNLLTQDVNYFTDTGGLAEGAACITASGINGNIDQAGLVGINSPGTAFEDIVKAQGIVTTGTTTSGSPTLTIVSGLLGTTAGMTITGAGIPAGTTALAAGGVTITMSANATATATGVVVVFNGLTANLTHTLPPVAGTLAVGLTVPAGVPTFTPGTNVTSCACVSSCTNTRGRITIAGGTATTGTICTVTWSSTLTTAPFFTLGEMGAVTPHGLDHGTATATSVTITAASSVSGATMNVDYETQP